MTTVTLRKAKNLEDQLMKLGTQFKPVQDINISIYTPSTVAALAESARDKLADGLTKALELVRGAYAIRELIGEANAKAGINVLIGRERSLSAQEKLISSVLGSGKDTGDFAAFGIESDSGEQDVATVQARLDAQKARVTTGYSQETVRLNVLDASTTASLNQQLAVLRRAKRENADAILEKNISTTIELPDSVVGLLKEYDIL